MHKLAEKKEWEDDFLNCFQTTTVCPPIYHRRQAYCLPIEKSVQMEDLSLLPQS